MKVRSIPAGIAALVVALGFAWEMWGTSGGQPTNADGQPRPRAVAVRALARGDRLDWPQRRLARQVPTARSQQVFAAPAQQVFTARFGNAFAVNLINVSDEVANVDATNDTALAYAPAQAPARSIVAQRAAPKRSIVPPEKPTRLASLGPSSAASPALADLDDHTAIYDISAHTIFLPGGEKLEAHSGLGSHIDDPHSVSMRNRGVTPPNVYRLALREHVFHGVRALRLIPVGDGNMYGRDGILAHTYMLGPNGQSNGCLAVRNYSALLQAFLSGRVERLVVVDRLTTSNPRIASLH